MRFRDFIERNVVVFEMTGSIVGGRGTKALKDTVLNHVRFGTDRILLDLTEVNTITLEGQHVLLGTARAVRGTGARIGFVNTDRTGAQVAVSKLVTVMERYDTREEALLSLGSVTTELSAD